MLRRSPAVWGNNYTSRALTAAETIMDKASTLLAFDSVPIAIPVRVNCARIESVSLLIPQIQCCLRPASVHDLAWSH